MSAATATAAAVRAPLPRGSDSLRNALAAKGNPIADLILSKDDPRRATRKTAYAARKTAETCGRCGYALNPEEPVWREQCAREPGYFGGTSSILAPVCDPCHSQYQRFWHEHPCGHCGRPVYNAVGFQGRDVFCSERCHNELHKARLRRRRTEARDNKTCPSCGGDFVPSRSDQVTCTPACRQKAYRQRSVTDSSPPAAVPPESRNEGPADSPFLDRRDVTAIRRDDVCTCANRNGEADTPAFLDRRDAPDATSNDEGRSK